MRRRASRGMRRSVLAAALPRYGRRVSAVLQCSTGARLRSSRRVPPGARRDGGGRLRVGEQLSGTQCAHRDDDRAFVVSKGGREAEMGGSGGRSGRVVLADGGGAVSVREPSPPSSAAAKFEVYLRRPVRGVSAARARDGEREEPVASGYTLRKAVTRAAASARRAALGALRIVPTATPASDRPRGRVSTKASGERRAGDGGDAREPNIESRHAATPPGLRVSAAAAGGWSSLGVMRGRRSTRRRLGSVWVVPSSAPATRAS